MLHPKYVRAPVKQFWEWVIPAVGSLVGGMMSNDSNEGIAQDATQFNAAQAALNRNFQSEELTKQRAFSSAEASRQMGFQEEMSNTSYQRAVSDMKDAGLNPMLAVMKGGASTPAGAAGTSSAASGAQGQAVTARMNDVLSPAVAAAQQARRVDAEVANMEAQRDLINAQRDKTAQETINLGTESDRIVASTEQLRAAARESGSRYDVNVETLKKITQDIAESASREKVNEVEAILKRLSVAEMKVLEKFYSEGAGEISPTLKMILQVIHSALSARGR